MTDRRKFISQSILGAMGITLGGVLSEETRTGQHTIKLVNRRSVTGIKVKVKAEEKVYKYIPADNGAGPMWCHGSTCIVRIGDQVFATGLETVPEWKPLNNCRWMLFRRHKNRWEHIMTDSENRTREPSPLAVFHDGRLFLSANPTLTGPEEYNGPSKPGFYVFDSSDPRLGYKQKEPEWDGNPPFTEHSYRSLAADGAANELIIFQNIGYTHAEWTFLDAGGKWSAQGRLEWPWGSDYEVPEPVRVCYPNVMIKNRAVYFCGVSDIIEPKKAWRDFKRQITGREWDYDFRRLFFTWTEDITKKDFHNWIEIASREDTCGWIYPADLWVSDDGSVHLLWTERAIDERLREKFYPGAKQSHALNYAVVRNGIVEKRHTLVMAEEGGSDEIPRFARFHIIPENRLLVVYYVEGRNAMGQMISENRIMELPSDGSPGAPVTIPISQPFNSFFTATVRGGTSPSNFIDMLGTINSEKNSIHYAKILVK